MLDKLPPEALRTIADYLTPRQRFESATACKAWQKAALDDTSFRHAYRQSAGAMAFCRAALLQGKDSWANRYLREEPFLSGLCVQDEALAYSRTWRASNYQGVVPPSRDDWEHVTFAPPCSTSQVSRGSLVGAAGRTWARAAGALSGSSAQTSPRAAQTVYDSWSFRRAHQMVRWEFCKTMPKGHSIGKLTPCPTDPLRLIKQPPVKLGAIFEDSMHGFMRSVDGTWEDMFRDNYLAGRSPPLGPRAPLRDHHPGEWRIGIYDLSLRSAYTSVDVQTGTVYPVQPCLAHIYVPFEPDAVRLQVGPECLRLWVADPRQEFVHRFTLRAGAADLTGG